VVIFDRFLAQRYWGRLMADCMNGAAAAAANGKFLTSRSRHIWPSAAISSLPLRPALRLLALVGLSSVIVLTIAAPVLSADVVLTEAGADGSDGDDGANGEDGTGSASSVLEGGTFYGTNGDDGDDGINGDAGTTGLPGGDVTHDVTAEVDGSLVVSTNGGTGGAGGDGGSGGAGGIGTNLAAFGSLQRHVVAGDGGEGGNGGRGGAGGSGGAAGDITLDIDAPVLGDVTLSAVGGTGGTAGAGGNGGAGGQGGDAQANNGNATSGDGGDGGDGVVGGAGGPTNYAYGSSGSAAGAVGDPGESLGAAAMAGAAGTDGADGNIVVAVNSGIGGNLNANAGTGTIDITLNKGASVGGTIAANVESSSTLRISMTLSSKSHLRAAERYLGDQANAISGSLTVNGQTFTWVGFDALVAALKFAGVSKVDLILDAPTPHYLSCSPRLVTAFYLDNAIALVAKQSTEHEAFRIGHIIGETTFQTQNTGGWTVKFTGEAGNLAFDVVDGKNAKIATCHG
jgi:hypothetical protein